NRIISRLTRGRDPDAAIGMNLDKHLAASLSPLHPLEGDPLIAVAKAKGWSWSLGLSIALGPNRHIHLIRLRSSRLG
ncbi:hypothetical protein, partial [Aeromonas caviae]|uniref:hypothetical protein n=1 Tax=Aeromonas caviae TaxID=648 RepID=UPI0025B63D82